MNAHTTISTAGLPKRKLSVADVERMVAAGIMAEDERVELIDGDLIVMSPKGMRHELLKRRFLRHFIDRGAAHYDFMIETTLRLSRKTYVEPDLVVIARATRTDEVRGDTVLLAVEVADTSLDCYLARKPAVYAAHGLREVWVIDAAARVLHVHRDPEGAAYRSIVAYDRATLVTPLAAPDLALRLDDLDWED